MLFLFGVFGVEFDFGKLHSHLVGKDFHGVVEGHRFHFHNELYDVAARAATETVIPAVIHAKRSRFFIVERTATEITSAFFLQGDVLRNDFDDVAFIFEFFHKLWGKTACHSASKNVFYIYIRTKAAFFLKFIEITSKINYIKQKNCSFLEKATVV